MHFTYRLLSILATLRAAFRGPAALARNLLRKQAHKSLARSMRKLGL